MSSDLLQNSLAAILELYGQTQNDPRLPVSVTYKRYSGHNPPNATVIAFCCSPICTVQHLQGGEAAVQLYGSIHGQLRQEKIDITKKTDGASFPFHYLMAGNNYRRMVEPLDIAEYYKQCKKDYWALGRSEHYNLLKKWLDRPKNAIRRNKACSFNEDSCFWAHVEEALISLGMLKEGESSPEDEELLGKLNKFEEDVMESIHNQLVDPEIFLERSSLMTWWNIYKGRKGSEYNSPLANFMMNKSYQSYS